VVSGGACCGKGSSSCAAGTSLEGLLVEAMALWRLTRRGWVGADRSEFGAVTRLRKKQMAPPPSGKRCVFLCSLFGCVQVRTKFGCVVPHVLPPA
jgi:hypothetical protein